MKKHQYTLRQGLVHQIKFTTCLFNLEANKSMSGVPHKAQILVNTIGFSCHSVGSSKFLELKYASEFALPGICEADIQIPRCLHHNQIVLAHKCNLKDFVPPILLI